MIDHKKKKHGLMPMNEKMGLNEGSDYFSPKSRGILPTAEAELNERNQETKGLGNRVRNRMTGRV